MPIRKFRDVADMPDETWREPGSPELARAIAGLWDFAARTAPRRFPPGVFRFRSIEEAEAANAAWEAASFRLVWQGRSAAERAAFSPRTSGEPEPAK